MWFFDVMRKAIFTSKNYYLIILLFTTLHDTRIDFKIKEIYHR